MLPWVPVFPAPGSGCVVLRTLYRASLLKCPPSALAQPTSAWTAPGDCWMPSRPRTVAAHCWSVGSLGKVALRGSGGYGHGDADDRGSGLGGCGDVRVVRVHEGPR